MRILVTGASGFVGRGLGPALVRAGHVVRAAARDATAISPEPAVERVRLPDLAGEVDWTPLLDGADAVVHLAGIAHRSGVEAGDYDRVIRHATAALARECAARRLPLVFVSSIGAQTGSAADHVVRETDPPRPVTAYDRAKLAAEAAVREAGGAFTILRPPLVYGPGVKGNMALLMRIADRPWPLPLGAFRNRRSLVARDNLAEAVAFCLATPATRGETYVVADREALSVAEMIAVLRTACGRPQRLIPVPPPLIGGLLCAAGRAATWDRIGGALVVDPGKLLAAGWRPAVDTRAGLAAMMRAYRSAARA
ncbi:NAD-dependent epimerase/dehydratase family protein [Rhodoplanes azumiensis]|uniref:NAD-dependent epimerase/dehydratase family protein n=1 Tax=Rhodoplanes azumiensis TaxID=1897628 RepID=A0ABW5AJV8_9BRAD